MASSEETHAVLYSYFRSSCSARLRIALNLKELPYEFKYVNILKGEQLPEEFDAINPSHFVPSLRLPGGKGPPITLVQSVALLEYLEEKHPQSRPLLPPASDPLGRARVRALVNVVACDIQPVTNLRILKRVRALGGSAEEWSKELMTEGLVAYEKLVQDTAGVYSCGDSVTLADICLVPAVWGAQRFGVELDSMPSVMRIFDAMSRLDAVKKAHWTTQEDTPADLRAQ